MTSLRNRMLVVASFALAAIFASASPAVAQPAFKGNFTLTHEVRWQNFTLPAGDYTFEIKSISVPSLIALKGPNGSSFIPALVANERDAKCSARDKRHQPRCEKGLRQGVRVRPHRSSVGSSGARLWTRPCQIRLGERNGCARLPSRRR